MSHTAVLGTASPESVGISTARLAHLDAALAAEVARQKLPGGVAMVARRGKVVHFSAFGRRDPAVDEPMQKDALFRIYSMTKPIVSVAAMRLVEQGHLLLAQPVSTWLPEFASLQVDVDGDAEPAPARPVTVHDLLRHTAGFTYQFMGASPLHQRYAAARLFSRGLSNADFCAALAQLPLVNQPGAAWTYSHATDVLGRLVEVIAGEPLGAHLQRTILGPLGMDDTSFHVAPDQQHRLAEPFATDPDNGTAVRLFDVRTPAVQEMGGAGLVSTAADYARFMEMMLAGGALGDVRLLSPKTVRLMTSDHLGAIPVTGELLPPGHGFGLGFAVRLQHGLAPGAGTAGMYYWGGLSGTSFLIDPQEQLHAQLLIQQPGRREHYRALFRELVYAALLD